MTQKIEPTYVTREQANRLKEKEFDLPTYAYYSGLNFYTGEYKNHSQTTIGDTPMHKMLIGYTSAPEQWQVVEWLRVNHGIWIKIDHFMTTENTIDWDFEIDRVDTDVDERGNYIPLVSFDVGRSFVSPQEAYSAAFDYILNNLI